ncbi:SDR family NAD(P)-dependent oxidoreductase [Nocardia sp. NPDC050175]|uniref:SDR family NAD(P)-dependent oxidoreductase n=1 Tax=Nocardia sp. NPDC050175 TaxID=3364317 RepID=UPI00379B0CE5
MNSFTGRSAIVTGGARGIGAAIVQALVKENIAVVIADLLEPEGKELTRALGPNVMFQRHDVTDKQNWRDLIDQAALPMFDRRDIAGI